MPPSEFNFGESSSEPAGWRLERLEMANWGTFGGKIVHVLAPECGWTLLVGENGSGKSTAIDALRTLLAPRATLRHSFNDAAGGQRRQDRSLSSYIRGAWSASSEEGSGDAETRYLRKEEEPSFLLAVFRNRRQQATLTLAQILRVSNGKDEPTFLVAPGEKSITADLTNLDASRSLKKDLTARGFDVRDTYKAYREDFCSRMGIPGEGALEIFNQAIGVKEVSDVGIFLRRHLLSASSIADFVRDSVVPQFGNLESCWNDIAKAKAQIEMLSPIVEAHAKIQDINAKKKAFDDLSAQWITIFEWKEMGLLRDYLDICAENLAAAKAKVASLDETLTAISAERDALLLQQAGLHVTAQIESIKIRIKEADFRCKERRTKQTQLASILRAESLGPVPGDEAEFADMRERVASKREENERLRLDDVSRGDAARAEKNRAAQQVQEIDEELAGLRERGVLIPLDYQNLRRKLCDETGIPIDQLPFAGELMEVKGEYAKEWEGAIEKLLRPFGISLLVPERHYQKVVPLIDSRRLIDDRGRGLRLQFHRVPAGYPGQESPADEKTVAGRLNFRDEHPLARWVSNEVLRSFPHVCCHDTKELERERRGITANGTTRDGSRHVKDDRTPLGSRRDYVLGWSPEQKIQQLNADLDAEKKALAKSITAESESSASVRTRDQRISAFESILGLSGFADIDFSSEQGEISRLTEQQQELEASSDKHRVLEKQIKDADGRSSLAKSDRDNAMAAKKQAEASIAEFRPNLDGLEKKLLDGPELDIMAMDAQIAEFDDGVTLTHTNVREARERRFRKLQGTISQLKGRISDEENKMINPMTNFVRDYREDAEDLGPNTSFADEFVEIHQRLIKDDLPRHEERFRDFLNTNLHENIAGLEDRISDEVKRHKDRIWQVNTALAGLDYGQGTYVEIDPRETKNIAIRDFKARLRGCLSSGLSQEEEERRALFWKIRELVSELSKASDWATQVMDTRLWLEFGVREKRRSDDTEIQYLSSSTGKSGGQKAKLAFTILSASLLAQYGLADDPTRLDSFRLVVVDEVFARTDEENSRRALNLFKTMGFQLLVAAPWKAEARIAEQYVDSFHLAVNPDGDASRIQRATRAEYEEKRSS